ncbi:hypothetical protein BH11PLA1_BH11PLA1_14980 [soil metagenome]
MATESTGSIDSSTEQGRPSGGAASDAPAMRYTAALAQGIEARWQERWAREKTFAAPNPSEPGFDGAKGKQYVLDMFPYPSGAGLHVGHPLGYIATDIFARYQRMLGKNVLHAMGFDAFGLPAEQYAVQHNVHPREAVERNIATMRTQLARLGLAHDPRRSVSTTDEAFMRWTQWIFLQIYHAWFDEALSRARPISELEEEFKGSKRLTRDGRPWDKLSGAERAAELDGHRLAYLAEVPVNWCPMLGTVLANEEVTADGRSERGNYPVYKRGLKQWMMRITAYAERLLQDLEHVDWPEKVKVMQRNWIGRSEGALVDFACANRRIRVFTTRPDTLFGATYLVLAPDHALVDELTTEKYGATVTFTKAKFPGAEEMLARGAGPKELVAAYRVHAAAAAKAAAAAGHAGARDTASAEKTGVFIGAYAVNPISEQRVPVYVADYVLSGYGTGAIMAVPAHDERDFEFARVLGLPIRDVVYPRALAAAAYYAQHGMPTGVKDATGDLDVAEIADLMAYAHPQAHAAVVATPKHEGVVPAGGTGATKWLSEALSVVRTRRAAHGGGDAGKAPEGKERRGPRRDAMGARLESASIRTWEELRAHFVEARHFVTVGTAFAEPGVAANSAAAKVSINGMSSAEAKGAVGAWLELMKFGKPTVNFKLRDWLFSRQRYWGEPFPIVFDEAGVARALPEAMLPVTLPHLDNFQPESSEDPNAAVKTPLDRAPEWVNVTLDLGDGPKAYRRETNTMPNWAGSCWYYLRYLDPENARAMVDPVVERYWMAGVPPKGSIDMGHAAAGGVDLYVGGVEHAVLHLLYARFWHKVLHDLGHVSTPEPFAKLFNQGYIQSYAFTDERGVYVDAFAVKAPDGRNFMEAIDDFKESPGPFTFEGRPVTREYGKMGKSLKNAMAPDEICAQYGCDTLRLYEMSMGPLDQSKPWNVRDIPGAYRFLQRVWRNVMDEQTGAARVGEEPAPADLQRALHKTVKGVREDLAALQFNTAIAKLIEFNNALTKFGATGTRTPRGVAEAVVLMLGPLAPHIAEEMWSALGHAATLAYEKFPEFDPALVVDDQIEVPVQIQGKVKHRITVPAGTDAQALEEAALADEKVKALIEGKPVKKVIVVPGKMVNIVL